MAQILGKKLTVTLVNVTCIDNHHPSTDDVRQPILSTDNAHRSTDDEFYRRMINHGNIPSIVAKKVRGELVRLNY